MLKPLWLLPVGMVLAVVGMIVSRVLRTRIGNRAFARIADPKLAELLRRTHWSVYDVLEHADSRGYLRLRDYLAWTQVTRDDG